MAQARRFAQLSRALQAAPPPVTVVLGTAAATTEESEAPLSDAEWQSRRPGTVVEGFDLTALTPENAAQIQRLLWLHGVLVFRGQPLSHAQQSALTDWFGPQPGPSAFAAPHTRNEEFPALLLISNKPVADVDALPPDELSKTEGATNFGLVWHSDYYYTLPSGHATILQAIEPPSSGGETLFADCAAAYSALTPAQRAKYSGGAIHSMRQMYERLPPGDLGGYGRVLSTEELTRFEDVHKSLVRTHPHTGRPSLFPGQANSVFPDGVPPEEARWVSSV
jgi:taurine dioxygenase